MAVIRFSEFTTTTPAVADLLAITDVSDTTMGAGGSTRQATVAQLLALTDRLAPLANAEISVTGATTLTIGRQHVCSGTTSAYTVTLPSPSGNTGKSLAVRMSSALTKLVTLDAGTGVAIDGQQTRVMRTAESAVLYCDGSNWFKLSGRTRAMSVRMIRNAALNISASTTTKVPLDTTIFDDGGMADTSNGRINVVRDGIYIMAGTLCYANVGTATTLQARLHKNGSTSAAVATSAFSFSGSGGYPSPLANLADQASAGDTYELYGYQTTGSTAALYVADPVNFLYLVEVPTW